MSVNVMNGLHEKCQSVNQASFMEYEPTKVFLHGCHTLVSVPVLVNVSGTFILDGFECLDSGLLMRVPHDAAIFHGWSNQTLVVNFTSGALSLASPGVPGNCRKQCSVPGRSPWEHHGRTRGTDGNIERACVVLYFRQKHDGRNE